MLRRVRFFGPTLNNVKFIRCTFNGTNLDRTKNSRIEVEYSKIVNTSFSDGQLIAVFRNSKFIKGSESNDLTSLKPPSSLTFEKSELDDVDFSRSTLNELVLDTVKSRKSGFDTGTVGKVTITGGDISFGFSETKIDALKVYDLNSVGLGLDGAVVKKMHVSDCRGTKDLNLYQATVGRLDVTRCPLDNFTPAGSTIDVLYVKDGSISNSEFRKMKARTVILENVILDGTLNFTGAHVTDLQTKNVTKQPGLKLLTEGSNVRF
jgi:uncharacterized protein YjbI with pentapeptide repeats